MKNTLFFQLGAALLIGAMCSLPLQGEQDYLAAESVVGDPPAQLPANQAAEDTFTGKIVSMNGQYLVLRDDTNDVWYHLDDQARARNFLGKAVAVKGELDRTGEIHVHSIQER